MELYHKTPFHAIGVWRVVWLSDRRKGAKSNMDIYNRSYEKVFGLGY